MQSPAREVRNLDFKFFPELLIRAIRKHWQSNNPINTLQIVCKGKKSCTYIQKYQPIKC